MYANSDSGVPADGSASLRSLNCWLDTSVAAKFMRASSVPVENQSVPNRHPETSGGSNRTCPMLASGVIALLAENPVHPTALINRVTYSTGHE